MATRLLAANWKMHKSPSETAAYFTEFFPRLNAKPSAELVFLVPAMNLPTALACGASAPAINLKIGFGLQNCAAEVKGALTGENSAGVAKDLGASWQLLGHSERRQLFHETDQQLEQKLQLVFGLGLKCMYCVGETLAERESGKTTQVVTQQLQAISKQISSEILCNAQLAIAYEPVWAIGTGKVATPAQAAEVHTSIRDLLTHEFGKTAAESTSLLYGGSVKADSAEALLKQDNIDGFLVGGASLVPNDLLGIWQWF